MVLLGTILSLLAVWSLDSGRVYICNIWYVDVNVPWSRELAFGNVNSVNWSTSQFQSFNSQHLTKRFHFTWVSFEKFWFRVFNDKYMSPQNTGKVISAKISKNRRNLEILCNIKFFHPLYHNICLAKVTATNAL